MQLAAYRDLADEVLFRLPAPCADPFILNALRRAGVEFCKQSNVWYEKLPAIDLVADREAYTIATVGHQAQIKDIERVYIRNATEVTDGDDGTEQDLGGIVFDHRALTLTFSSAPASQSVTDGLLVYATLVPDFMADEIPAWILKQWPYAIAAGAAANIAGSRLTPQCYDPDLQAVQSAEFRLAIGEAQRYAETRGRRVGPMVHKGFRMEVS